MTTLSTNGILKYRTKDIVFILGDVSFAKEDVTLQCLSQLNGNLYLVTGNHDKGLPLQRFERVYNNYAEIKIDNVDVVMSLPYL